MNTVDLTTNFPIKKEHPILMLPLKIETRFMRIADDASLAELIKLNNDIESIDTDIRSNIASTGKTLENSLENQLQSFKESTYNKLLEINSRNQIKNKKITQLTENRTQLFPLVKKEAKVTEEKLRKDINPLSRTQRRLTYRINYFSKKLASKIEESIIDEAKTTRWTKGRKKKVEKAIQELFKLYKVLVGQEIQNKELINIQRSAIAAFDILNTYIKGKYNLHNPEFEKIVVFSGRLMAEGKLFGASISKRIHSQRIPLEASRKVIRSKRLDTYVLRYEENVLLAAPSHFNRLSKLKKELDLLIYLNKRKVEEVAKFGKILKKQKTTIAVLQKELPQVISTQLSEKQKELSVQITALKDKTGYTQSPAIKRESNSLKKIMPLKDSKDTMVRFSKIELAAIDLDQKIQENKLSDQEITEQISQLESELQVTQESLKNSTVETSEAENILDDFNAFLTDINDPIQHMNMNTGGTIGTIPNDPTTPTPPNGTTFTAAFTPIVSTNNPLEFTFQNDSYNSTGASFDESSWDFRDGNTQIDTGKSSPTHTFLYPGTYNVRLGIRKGTAWKYLEKSVEVIDGAIQELWIRAYPDTIAIHSLREQLTEAEANAGIIFWDATWNSLGDTALELSAWTSLVKKYGPQRAAWIIKTTTPTNIANRPKQIMDHQTDDDLKKGIKFWDTINQETDDVIQQDSIWKEFQKSTSPERALEIAFSSLEVQKNNVDLNVEKKSNQKNKILPVSLVPQYPRLTYAEKSWDKGSESRVMPSKLLFAVYRRNGESPYLKFGNNIPNPLPTGLDPNDDNAFAWDEHGNLIVSGAIKWMVDFEEAIRIGMAVRIPITAKEASPLNPDAGFERVTVVGARDQDTNPEAKIGLQNLFENHHYTKQGLSFVAQGTATNNTGTESSGFSPQNLTTELSFEVEQKASKTAKSGSQLAAKKALQKTDGDLLAEQLGIDPSVFNHILGADEREVTDATAMNQALWAGTLGSYLEDIFYSNDPTYSNIFNQETLDNVRDFFINNVKARGSFPVLRIKNQPYGILPMTNFKKENSRDFNTLGTDFNSVLEDVLVHRLWKGFVLGGQWEGTNSTNKKDATISGKWASIVSDSIKNIDDPTNNSLLEYQKCFTNLLGLLPHSTDVFVRKGIGIEAKGDNFSNTFPTTTAQGNTNQFSYSNVSDRVFNFYEKFYDIGAYKQVYSNTNGRIEFNKMIEGTQLSKIVYTTDETEINNLIDIDVASKSSFLEEIKSGKNYLQLLSGKSFEELIEDIKDERESSNSLLHLLCRKSIMQSYWDASARIWDDNILVDHLYHDHFISHPEPPLAHQSQSDFLTLLAINNYNGLPLSNVNISDILSLVWNLCLHNEWDLKDLYEFSNNANIAQVTGHNPYNWNEWQVKSIARVYLIDWDAVNASLRLNMPRGIDALGSGNSTTYSSLEGINPKQFVRGVFSRDKYKSFVTEMNAGGFFDVHFNFNSNSTPSNNWMDFFRNTSFANKLHFLELDQTFTNKTDSRKMHEYLSDTLQNPLTILGIGVSPEIQRLRGTKVAIDYLAKRPTLNLEKTLLEHIDLCSYRLDAWITGLVNQRLTDLRALPGYTTRVGAYGWVENLKPGGTRKDINDTPIEVNQNQLGEATPAIDPENQGFIHAPTANHAAAAAILRSAYIQTEADVYQVNLSSQRVRKAKKFIDGIRGGIALPELLGYEFERALHDINPDLNQYIQDFRQAFPMVANQLEDANTNGDISVNKLAARSVVNGLALLEAKRAGIAAGNVSYPFGIMVFPTNNFATQVLKAIEKIEDTLDGLGDLTIAETVYQAANGNFARSGAMAKALSAGTPIPEPEIIKTTKHKKMISLRTGIILPTTGLDVSNPWSSIPLTIKAQTEPVLNAWLADQIGDPSNVIISYSYDYIDTDGVGATYKGTISLYDLQLHPIDLLSIMGEIKGGASEIHHRIELYIFSHTIHVSIHNIQINLSEKDPLAPVNHQSLMQIYPLITELFKVVNESNPMKALDLALPGVSLSEIQGGEDFVELETRINIAGNKLNQLTQDLTIEIERTTFDHVLVRNILLKIADYNIAEALPYNATGISDDDEIRLRTIAQLVQNIIKKRLKQFQKELNLVQSISTTLAPEEKMDGLTKMCEAIFGNCFYLLPQFKIHQGKDLEYAVNNSLNIIPNDDPLAMEQWLHGIGSVRSKMGSLENVMLLQELYDNELIFKPVQLPHRPTDQWMGLEYNPSIIDDTEEKLALYVSIPDNFQTDISNYCGLLIDNWTEQITVKEEDTAIAFHYDQPNAKPAQSILLGVHSSKTSGNWDYDELLKIVESTAEMTRLRAVEPDQLLASTNDASSLVLPGIVDKITDGYSDISTDFGINLKPSNPVTNDGSGGSSDTSNTSDDHTVLTTN